MRITALILLAGIAFTVTAIAEPNAAEQIFRFHYDAAKRGNPESMYILANMYERGRGVKRNYDEAIRWYSKAVKFGINRAETKIQELKQKKAQASIEAAEIANKKREQQAQQEMQTQLKQQVAEQRAAEQAKANAERAAMLLQQQIETAKMQTEKALKEMERIRMQQEQIAREKAELEQLRHSLLEQEQQYNAQTNNTDSQQESESEVKEFKADPCDGPSARFMSTCR